MKTILCPHCGRENPVNLLCCGHCQQNLPFFPPKKESETAPREVTPEETKLMNQITRMEMLMFIFVLIPVGVALLLVFLMFTYSATPDGGFAVMALLFKSGMWSPLLLIPAVGLFSAWEFKQRLTERLNEMTKKDK